MKEKNNMKKRKIIIPKELEGYTSGLPNDDRETLVFINDKLYRLQECPDLTINKLLSFPFEKVPHVRILNPIPIRTEEEQKINNKDDENLHGLYRKGYIKKKKRSK